MKQTALAVTLVVTMLAAITGTAQDFSNKGKEFFIAYPAHIDNLNSVMGVYITSDVSATGELNANGAIVPFTVVANQVTRIFLGPNGDIGNANVYLDQHDAILPNYGIKVTADRDIIVYAHIIRSARSGATLVLPTKVWGREYYIPSFRNTGGNTQGGNSGWGEFAVIASKENTTVEITPALTGRNGAPAAGVPYRVTLLNPGDVYFFQGEQHGDISGTTVRSVQNGNEPCKPIAVFSATTWSGFDCTAASGGDNLFQQLFPTGAWGKTFLTAPFIDRPYDIIRVYVKNSSTIVNKTEAGITSQLTNLNPAGNFFEFKTTNPTLLEASEPVQVAQYIVSQTCDQQNPDRQADPEMTMLNPIDQTLSKITLFSAHANYVPPGQTQVDRHFLNIIIPTVKASTLKIDNAAPNGTFVPIPNTTYSYLQENVTGSSAFNPVHTIQADTGFTAIAYGYGNVESYGYNAGTNVVDRYQFMTVQNQYSTVNFPASCQGTPFYLSMTFPYEPDTITWNFGTLGFPPVVIANPSFDSTWVVDDKTLYQYQLPLPYTIFAPGTYPLSVTAVNPTSDNCSGEQVIDFDLQIFPPPTSDFSFTLSGCATDTVYFTDQSNSNGRPVQSYSWNFGDNTTDDAQHAKHKYSGPGSYIVTHSIITDIGCISAPIEKIVALAPPPVAGFTVAGGNCAGATITFTDASIANPGNTLQTWYWNFGDGSPLVQVNNSAAQTHTYNTPGTYNVSLVVETSTGCKSFPQEQQLVIGPQPRASFTFPASVCLPSGATQFTNTSTISDGTQSQITYSWDFGDGGSSTALNPLHNYSGVGPFNVTLTATSNNGCTHDTTIVVNTIFAQPIAAFNLDSIESCLGGTLNFTDQSTAAASAITAWSWNFGDGGTSTVQNPTHQYAAPGTYNVTLSVTSTQNCVSAVLQKTVTVLALPTASFTISNPLCAAENVLFTSTSTAVAGTITQYNWSVNGNSIPGGQTATYTPPAAGAYTVQLSITTDKGCSGTATNSMNVNPKPNADFATPVICLPSGTAPFNNLTTMSDGSISTVTYLWNFGDGNTSTQTNPTHTYATSGPFNVTLEATSANGCKDSEMKVLNTVYNPPVAAFNAPAEVCMGAPVNFQDQSSAQNSTVNGWTWNFGDNTPISTAQNPSHTYAAPGTYNVTLSVTSQVGCPSAPTTKQIVVNALPRADFNYTTPNCATRQINFTSTSVANAGTITGYNWVFGDGNTSTQQNPVHSYTAPGTYTATLTVTTDKGCVSPVFTRQIVVGPLPVPSFTMPEVCFNDPIVQFTNTSTISDGSQSQFTYLWNFGDNTTSTQQHGQHNYPAAGNYNVSLTVTSNSGCAATVTQSFVVNGSPMAAFAIQGGNVRCSDNDVTITDNSTVDFGSLMRVEIFWDYTNDPTNKVVDNNPAAGKNYTYHYPAFGSPASKTVTIRVVAYSGENCINSSDRTITLHAKPALRFDAIAGICADVPAFQVSTASEINGIPGNGVFSGNGINASGLFTPATAGAGDQVIRYTYTTTDNCTNFIEQVIPVYELPKANAGPDRVFLEGGSITLVGNGSSGPGLSYLWTPATNLDNPASSLPKATPTADITYTLRVTTVNGCWDEDEVFVKLLLKPVIPNAFSPNGDGINDKWEVTSLESYPGSTVQIFNRYGQLVFTSKGYSRPWDGTYKGKDVPAGTYYYIVDPKNGREKMSGFVDVLR